MYKPFCFVVSDFNEFIKTNGYTLFLNRNCNYIIALTFSKLNVIAIKIRVDDRIFYEGTDWKTAHTFFCRKPIGEIVVTAKFSDFQNVVIVKNYIATTSFRHKSVELMYFDEEHDLDLDACISTLEDVD